ncbi:MAG: M20/M25/M40 family metallo-hydrolase, partial [Verrucomicrobiota bacterium]
MNTATDLLQHLIRIPSVNPDGGADGAISGEKKMADAVASFLSEACGASVTLEEVRPERPNVIGRFGGSSTEAHDARPRLLFGPHTDTVGVKGMSIDPFSGDLRDGKIWGRGASDTKGSMAAMLWALREVSGEIDDLGCRPMFVGFMGEESNQYGSQHFAREHADEVDFALVGEPTELNAVHAHKACWWIRISVGGVAVHGSKPELGENAILK